MFCVLSVLSAILECVHILLAVLSMSSAISPFWVLGALIVC